MVNGDYASFCEKKLVTSAIRPDKTVARAVGRRNLTLRIHFDRIDKKWFQ